MISKKNKALAAGILATAMSASAIVPSFASAANNYATEGGANESYAKMFESLYADVITNGAENGYLSKNNNNGANSFGIPYHSVETLCVEAPDYGHETTSEAMSYIAWITAMHDVLVQNKIIDGSTGDLEKGWNTLEAMIPGWSKNSYYYDTIDYGSIWNGKFTDLKADTATEENDPSKYPSTQISGAGAEARNPLYTEMKSSYGSDNGYYLMHWLADVDDWYGFGGGKGQFTFINTFQRGEQESCFETVPQPCIEELKYGMTNTDATGIKGIFNGVGEVPEQYAFTNAPDAEDRAIQAIYFASNFGLDCGGLSALAGKMGDECRNDMFDKYYKAIGCQDINYDSSVASSNWDSQHFLMAWYTSWGGALDHTWYGGGYDWAWQIGCSHSHQFYQNPLAAYALAYDANIGGNMKNKNAQSDYVKSLQRQIEFYLWLQSADGPFAGGCTNSKNGKYEKYGANEATFYDMVYVEHPVYADPGSNHWIGNQVWSTQRLAELYYYVKTKGDATNGAKDFGGLTLEEALEKLLGRWINWFIENTKYSVDENGEVTYAIPSTLDWSGQPKTWNGTYDENANSGLTCEIKGYGQGDIGCVSSLCNTLIFYAKANGVSADVANGKAAPTNLAEEGLLLANELMSAQWNNARDDIGIAYKDSNGSLYRVFEQEVYIPSDYHGTMPDGSKLENGATFSSIRESYAKDPMYQEAKAVYDANKAAGATKEDTMEGYEFTLHRFWHMGDALMTTGTMALLYPDVVPINDPTQGEDPVDDILWGDANVDGKVTVADATAIIQYYGNKDKYDLSAQGKKNGDVVDNGDGITVKDALAIQKYSAGLIAQSDFPITGKELDDAK